MQNWAFKNAAAFSVIKKPLVSAQITITTIRAPSNQEAVTAAPISCTYICKIDAENTSLMKAMTEHWDVF